MIITVGGSIGSGKTTLARELARKFNLKHISAGMIMRNMAEKMRMSIEEFSEYAESDPDIDLEIDKQQKRLARGNCIVDGRLSGHFLDSDLKIWLNAPLEVRIARIAKREGKTTEHAKRDLVDREGSERKRYFEIYGLNIDDVSSYDLVINTAKFDVESIVEIVSVAVNAVNRVKNI